jgi:hypothetical protein
MARFHISYDANDLAVLELALSELVTRSHEAARILTSQIEANIQSKKMFQTVDIYRGQADRAMAIVKRMKQGYRGLQEVK